MFIVFYWIYQTIYNLPSMTIGATLHPQQLFTVNCISHGGLDFFFMQLDSKVNNIHGLKKIWPNLKQKIAEKILYMLKFPTYS